MNTLVIIIIVIVLLAAIGGGLYFAYQRYTDVKVVGRFVKLSQPTVNCMNIGDIQVFSGGINIAKGKTVTMSSKHSDTDFPATFLVDEIFTNFAHTSCKEAGWMNIDLGSDQP